MNYATSANRLNPAAALGAIGVPAAFGAVLIAGLAVTVVISKPDAPIEGYPIEVDLPDPPPPPPDTTNRSDNQTAQTQQTSKMADPLPVPTDFDFGFEAGPSTPIDSLSGAGVGPIGPVDFGGPIAPPTPMMDPVSASPRGNASRWVTDSDYRSNWIRKGLQGTASFLLTIDTSGKVSDCTITASTGHTELDTATCRLIEKRAKFDAARDGSGQPIAGSYRSSIRWVLPE